MKIGNAINFWFEIKINIKYNVMYSQEHTIIHYERIYGHKTFSVFLEIVKHLK
jgi:hypothetical protein